MGKYLTIQFKRISRLLPVLILVTALLLFGMYGAYQGLLKRWQQGEVFQKIQIGVVGTEGNGLLRQAVDVVTSIDSTKFSMEFITMPEQQAKTKLETGELSAYVVIPDSFLDEALSGNITPIRFVSSPGSENIFSIVKDELTGVVAEMLLLSEQGAYGLELALSEYGHSNATGEAMNRLAIEYAGEIIHRDEVYRVEEIGVWQGTSFENNLLYGLFTLFIFLLTLPFATIFVKDRWEVEWTLKSQGMGVFTQTLCQIVPYVTALAVLCVPAFWLFAGRERITSLLPCLICAATFSYLMFSVTGELISGVLLQLTVSLGMCFVSGCMYPVYFFPASIQKLSRWLPAAMMKESMTGSGSMILLVISAAFFLLSWGVRSVRMVHTKGVRL